jgi:peptidoglycan LD-endopeptidase LytH
MIITRTIFILIISLNFFQTLNAQSDSSIIYRWSILDSLIRDRKINKDAAVDSIKKFAPQVILLCKEKNLTFTKPANCVFPMKDFTNVSYRTNGKDYWDDNFDYFQGGEYRGHPAHDIFILDNDSNGIEDMTGNKTKTVSMVSGVVIAIHNNWKYGDFLRSGNYVKIFDPNSEAIFYYSHLDSVFVNVGDFVTAGQEIAYVGRSGRKAIKGRTHLHTAYYKIEDGQPIPIDIIKDLKRAEKKLVK